MVEIFLFCINIAYLASPRSWFRSPTALETFDDTTFEDQVDRSATKNLNVWFIGSFGSCFLLNGSSLPAKVFKNKIPQPAHSRFNMAEVNHSQLNTTPYNDGKHADDSWAH